MANSMQGGCALMSWTLGLQLFLLLTIQSSYIYGVEAARGLKQAQVDAKALAPGTDGLSTTTAADIIIVGAGMAGITTARQLADNTPANVIVLEARERSGGRLYSITTPYGRVDQGAMWIHDGYPGNPLYDLATTLNAPRSVEQDYLSASSFTVDGQPTDPTKRSTLYLGWLTEVTDRIEGLKTNPATNATSMDIPLLQIYQDYLLSQAIPPELQPTTNLMAHTAFQVLLNANLTELSTLRYGDAKTLPAVDVLLKDGFDSLVEALKPGIDIRYNTPVVEIAQNETGVTITTAAGVVYTAKYVVATQSLGCLKAGGVAFVPPLPENKLTAINEMGMGVLDKVILVYDQPFWNDTDFISREMVDLTGQWSTFLNYNKTLGMPVLVALNPAATARRLETLSDEDILSSLLTSLQEMYPGVKISQPREYYVTRWASDPWALGSYSFFAVGNPLDITSTLAEPVGRVLFAGEATSDRPATVLGAYLSGLREGERLVELIKSESA